MTNKYKTMTDFSNHIVLSEGIGLHYLVFSHRVWCERAHYLFRFYVKIVNEVFMIFHERHYLIFNSF